MVYIWTEFSTNLLVSGKIARLKRHLRQAIPNKKLVRELASLSVEWLGETKKSMQHTDEWSQQQAKPVKLKVSPRTLAQHVPTDACAVIFNHFGPR